MKTAYLEITLKIDDADRSAAAGVYAEYKRPFLDTVSGFQTTAPTPWRSHPPCARLRALRVHLGGLMSGIV